MGATVTFVGLQIPYYMGYKKVIIGFDYSYKENAIPSEMEIRTGEIEQSHFHSNCFPKG